MRRPPPRRRSTHLLFAAAVALLAFPAGADPLPATDEQPPGSFPRELLRAGERIVFSAWDRVHGREVWATDGTAEGTELLTEITPGPESPEILLHWSSAGTAYWSTGSQLHPPPFEPPPPHAHWTLWRSDGSAAGTYPVGEGKMAGDYGDCRAQPFLRPLRIAELEDGRTLFAAADLAAGWEPWVTDGTASGTRRLVDLLPGESGSCPAAGVSMGTYALFAATSPQGRELWRSDGTAPGTYPLRPPGEDSSPIVDYPLVRIGDRAVLFRRTLDWQWELWSTDGTAPGTRRVAAVAPVDPGQPPRLHVLGERAVYVAGLADDPDRHELWATDGTAAGTGLLTDFAWTQAFPTSPFLYAVIPFGDELFFQAVDYLLGHGLWATDGTREGTRFVTALPGAWPGHTVRVAPLRDRLGLVLRDPETGLEPWVLDPISGDRSSLGDLCRGACDSNPSFSAEVESGNLMVLRPPQRSTSPGRTPATLWVTDGTAGGTSRIAGPFSRTPAAATRIGVPVPPPYPPVVIALYPEARLGSRVPFVADDGVHGIELWMTDGTPEGTSMVFDLLPDGEGLEPAEPWDPGDPGPVEPPAGAWLTPAAVPGFAFKVRITPGGGASIEGNAEPACIPETLCVSGALQGRSEVFLRVVGPRPNGKLWPTVVKFTTSEVEVWIEQLSSGEIRHYRLGGARPGFDELPGLFDRDGFDP